MMLLQFRPDLRCFPSKSRQQLMGPLGGSPPLKMSRGATFHVKVAQPDAQQQSVGPEAAQEHKEATRQNGTRGAVQSVNTVDMQLDGQLDMQETAQVSSIPCCVLSLSSVLSRVLRVYIYCMNAGGPAAAWAPD
jgi:hypothetical protein